MGTLKSVCSYLSREIGTNQLEHTLLRVPISLRVASFCAKIDAGSRLNTTKMVLLANMAAAGRPLALRCS